jgi:hypothetical protein
MAEVERTTKTTTETTRAYVPPVGSEPVVPGEDRPHPPTPDQPDGPTLPGEAPPEPLPDKGNGGQGDDA